jgi:hypothetical protein
VENSGIKPLSMNELHHLFEKLHLYTILGFYYDLDKVLLGYISMPVNEVRLVQKPSVVSLVTAKIDHWRNTICQGQVFFFIKMWQHWMSRTLIPAFFVACLNRIVMKSSEEGSQITN